MQDPTYAKTQLMKERHAELPEATIQGAHLEVFRLTQEMAEATSHGFRGRCCSPPWWGMSVLREDLGQTRPAPARASGVPSRRSVQTRAPHFLARARGWRG